MATTFKSLATSNLPRATDATTGASVFMMGTAAAATDKTCQWWVPLESLLAMWTQYQDRWVRWSWSAQLVLAACWLPAGCLLHQELHALRACSSLLASRCRLPASWAA
jgi:hypothetical protein